MEIQGKHLINGQWCAEAPPSFHGINPATAEKLQPGFPEATSKEIEAAMAAAETAHEAYRQLPFDAIAGFLDQIAEEIMALGDSLLHRANLETALPEARLVGERARTVSQLKMFADLVREGSWVEASIDRALPERKPIPKPDLRRKFISIGPVVVFGASNFPFAYSVAGGDTASALAAGNPVVVKAHPAHPGTSELVAGAIQRAASRTGMPPGVFSMVHARSHEAGLQLVRHRATKAVGFTGSLQAGRALYNAAAGRPEPIPVYAEMGSTNPVFVLPGALNKNGATIAENLVQSVTLGVGQFCTNPGLVFGLEGEALTRMVQKASALTAAAQPGTMLYQGISDRFTQGVEKFRQTAGVTVAAESSAARQAGQAAATVFVTGAGNFLSEESLREELFGPATVIVKCRDATELEKAARALPGQLTATVHGTEEDLAEYKSLIGLLQQKVGRLIFNGFPTGVEVCPSMQHGGPYPATTDAHFTSVGTAAIKRFVRPVCFQNFPQSVLPPELQDKNVRGIWRTVDGKLTRDDLL